MFNAKVYTVSIPSFGVALEEEHIAREVIARWNIEEGEKHGVVYLAIPNNYRGITPDIYLYVIDNFVDEHKVEAAMQTGANVLLFFNQYCDEKNTIPSEFQRVLEYKEKIKKDCRCIEFSGKVDFEKALLEALQTI